MLRILLPREGGLTRTLRACLPLDIDGIDEALHTRYSKHIQRLSQVVNGPGSRIGLYFRVVGFFSGYFRVFFFFVGTHVLGVVPSFYSCRLSHGVLVRFLRFRLGCHHLRIHINNKQTNKQTFKVWQPQRAARSKRPNTPSDGSKNNGIHTTNQVVLIPKHVSRQDRAHDQEHHPLLHRLQWHGKQ